MLPLRGGSSIFRLVSYILSGNGGTGEVRNDLPTNPHRLSDCIRKFVGRRINNLSKRLIGPTSIVPQRLNDLSQILVSGDGEWFAIIPCFDCGESEAVLVDDVGEFVEQFSAI